MDIVLRPLFSVLTVPDLKLKKPSWIQMPSPWAIFAFVLGKASKKNDEIEFSTNVLTPPPFPNGEFRKNIFLFLSSEQLLVEN